MKKIPAVFYDTLELSALAFGGIGAYSIERYDHQEKAFVPWCMVGHLTDAQKRRVRSVTGIIGIGTTENDIAVTAINERKGQYGEMSQRVTFEEWCKELGVVRGN